MPNHPQTILITGATAGLGRHAALHLAARGHTVIATGRREALLETLRAEAKGTVHGVRLDVTDAESIAAARAKILELTGGRGVDALVNNAGYGLAGPIELLDPDDLRAQFETNVFGLVAVTRAFVPEMRARGAGRIVNVGSMGGRITFPLLGAYNATKYAVEALSDAMRYELKPFGIDVVLVEPGPIESDFSATTMAGTAAARKSPGPYAPYLADAEALQAKNDALAAKPIVVSRAVEKAIVRRRPRARYLVPFAARILVTVVQLLPTRLVDAVMRRMTGLNRPPAPEAAGTRTPVSEAA